MSRPITPMPGMPAPWWSDLNKAIGDNRLTKPEVTKYIKPYEDLFQDSLYGGALNKILDGQNPVKLTAAARKELTRLVRPEDWGPWMPTHAQLKKTYGNIAMSALRDGRAVKMSHEPAHLDLASKYDITPRNEQR